MIGMTKPATPLAALEKTLAALDFAETNAEIDRLAADRATLQAKADATEAEARRLDAEIRDWAGPDADAIADAILGGQSPGEAAQAARSREGLVEQRNALWDTANALRDRAEQARVERDQVAHRQRVMIAEAAEPYIEALGAAQVEAAERIIASGAALLALKEVTGTYLPCEWTSAKACKGVTGADSVLGWRDRIAVPADLVAVLKPLEDRAKGLRSPVPATVNNL